MPAPARIAGRRTLSVARLAGPLYLSRASGPGSLLPEEPPALGPAPAGPEATWLCLWARLVFRGARGSARLAVAQPRARGNSRWSCQASSPAAPRPWQRRSAPPLRSQPGCSCHGPERAKPAFGNPCPELAPLSGRGAGTRASFLGPPGLSRTDSTLRSAFRGERPRSAAGGSAWGLSHWLRAPRAPGSEWGQD